MYSSVFTSRISDPASQSGRILEEGKEISCFRGESWLNIAGRQNDVHIDSFSLDQRWQWNAGLLISFLCFLSPPPCHLPLPLNRIRSSLCYPLPHLWLSTSRKGVYVSDSLAGWNVSHPHSVESPVRGAIPSSTHPFIHTSSSCIFHVTGVVRGGLPGAYPSCLYLRDRYTLDDSPRRADVERQTTILTRFHTKRTIMIQNGKKKVHKA